MEPLAKVATWTPLEILAELKGSLPKGWKFDLTQDDGFWVAKFSEDEKVLWAEDNPSNNIVLLSAYAWLWLRLNHNQPRPRPGWSPRPQPVNQVTPAVRSNVPDPEDLDPNEVAAVYCRNHARGK